MIDISGFALCRHVDTEERHDRVVSTVYIYILLLSRMLRKTPEQFFGLFVIEYIFKVVTCHK